MSEQAPSRATRLPTGDLPPELAAAWLVGAFLVRGLLLAIALPLSGLILFGGLLAASALTALGVLSIPLVLLVAGGPSVGAWRFGASRWGVGGAVASLPLLLGLPLLLALLHYRPAGLALIGLAAVDTLWARLHNRPLLSRRRILPWLVGMMLAHLSPTAMATYVLERWKARATPKRAFASAVGAYVGGTVSCCLAVLAVGGAGAILVLLTLIGLH